MRIKVSDYIAKFLKEKNIKHVFAVSGGASLHLIHSVAKIKNIEYVCPTHEQACAMAADAYSRYKKNSSVVFTSSGPGATNLSTGICGAFFDSIPVIFITGQVSTFRSKDNLKVRQIGFQETECVSMYKSVTKYVYKIKKPEEIVYELEKAYFIANNLRPGPVLLDIPDNIQREFINLKKCKKFISKLNKKSLPYDDKKNSAKINLINKLLNKSKRPVLILGWGVCLSNAESLAIRLVSKLKIPTVLTWGAAHVLEYKNKYNLGTWGTHGTRYANFAVQNSDLVIIIGSRLDTKATGSPINTFARKAKKIMIDIDDGELQKFIRFNLKIDVKIHSDAKKFISSFLNISKKTNFKSYNKWYSQIKHWKTNYPICPEEYFLEKEINPYVFIKKLSKKISKNTIICSDTGCTIAWAMQAFEFKKNQKFFHDFNNTAMGWAIPAAIGLSFATNMKKQIICLVGDGSYSFNIQELAIIKKYKMPIKIFLLNNNGYSMIKQTQEQWLNSDYFASSINGGLSRTDFVLVTKAYGLKTKSIKYNKDIEKVIMSSLSNMNPMFCELLINKNKRVIPQVKFGRPNEDLEPLLDRYEFKKNMIIPVI